MEMMEFDSPLNDDATEIFRKALVWLTQNPNVYVLEALLYYDCGSPLLHIFYDWSGDDDKDEDKPKTNEKALVITNEPVNSV